MHRDRGERKILSTWVITVASKVQCLEVSVSLSHLILLLHPRLIKSETLRREFLTLCFIEVPRWLGWLVKRENFGSVRQLNDKRCLLLRLMT